MTRIARTVVARPATSPTAAALPGIAPPPVRQATVIVDRLELTTNSGSPAHEDDSPGTYSRQAGRRPHPRAHTTRQAKHVVDLTT